jgi:phospholipase/carboxylesterase
MADIKQAGKTLEEAHKVGVLIHGRGASAESILSLQDYLSLEEFALFAPQAVGGSWYPYSFMAPDRNNEPAFSHAIKTIQDLVDSILKMGFTSDQIYFIGFSQGACLSLEYAAQNAKKYGGVIAFTGGLIGEELNPSKYKGDFMGTPIFIGASKQDMHVPLKRIQESSELLENLGAKVKSLIFEDSEHTIRQEEIDWVNTNILK